MPNDSTNPLLVTYGPHQFDFATLPQTSMVAMLRRGVAHFMGSEQASKVTGQFKPDAEGKTKSDLPDTEENRAAALAEFQAKAYDAMLAGTVGVSVRGPSVDPISKIIDRLARKEVRDVLTANGVKPPKKADDIVTMPDGQKFTMDQLVARRLDPTGPSGVDKKTGVVHAERLGKEAAKIAAEAAKKAAKAVDAAKAEGLAGL